ncbi:MAG: fatty acid desaturase family protein, partial [Candidatus Binatia bacterium]
AIIMHEGAHYLLHPNRRVNDRLTNWLAAFPIGTTVEMYRCNHFRHHNHLGTPEDPDFRALCLPPIEHGLGSSVLGCLSGWRQLQLLLKYITGQRQTARPAGAPGLSGLAGRAVWHGVLLGTATLTGHPLAYVFVWLVPLFTFGVLINEVRSIVEHTPLVNGLATGELRSLEPLTRTVRPGWLDRLWIAPLNFSYHLEHHLYPGVPFSRLPELHRVLKELGYYEQRPDLLHAGYGSIVRALAGCFRQRELRPQVQVENGIYVAHRA